MMRLAYVIWFFWAVFLFVVFGREFYYIDYIQYGKIPETWQIFATLGLLFLPGAFIVSIRWIYRGFQPDKSH